MPTEVDRGENTKAIENDLKGAETLALEADKLKAIKQ